MDLIAVALALAGAAAGFGINQLSLKLSSKLERIFSNVAKTGGNTAKWVGWFLAIGLYGLMATGGVTMLLSKVSFKSLGAIKAPLGGFLSGFGLGGLASEALFQMPDLATIGKV